jgi:predicted TIM-barrel fold metal-dependent hydrolase
MIDPHHHLYDLERNVYPWLQLETPPELFVGDVSLYSDYGTLIRAFERIAIDLGMSGPELDALFYRTGERVYRLA